MRFPALIVLVAVSCAGRAGTPSSQRMTPDAAVALPAQEAAPPAPVRSERFEALLAERDSIQDWRNTFFQRPQTPPKGYRPIARTGRFPVDAIASARAYTFGYVGSLSCSSAEIEAGDPTPFTKNGTLCSDVVAPGAELSAEQWHRALGLITEAERLERELLATHPTHTVDRARTRCGFDPHHVIVFHDRAGAAIAKLLVCFTCGEWLAGPGVHALGGGEAAVMSKQERDTLAAIFDEVHQGAWLYDEKEAASVREYATRIYGSPDAPTEAGRKRQSDRVARGSGVTGTKDVRTLNADERSRMCLWFGEELSEHWGRGFECADGRKWSLVESADECAHRPTACAATAARVETCMASFLRPPEDTCAAKWPAECEGVLSCLPVIRLP